MKKLSDKQLDRLVWKLGSMIIWIVGGLYILYNCHPVMGYIIGSLSVMIFMNPKIIE